MLNFESLDFCLKLAKNSTCSNLCDLKKIESGLCILKLRFFSQNIINCNKYTNKGNNKITELRTILQRESQNS